VPTRSVRSTETGARYAQLHQDANPRLRGAAQARERLVVTCTLLGFWRSLIGEWSRKHAIARLGPRRPALGVVWRRSARGAAGECERQRRLAPTGRASCGWVL